MPATRCQPEPMKFKMDFIGMTQATSAHKEADNLSRGQEDPEFAFVR